MRSIRLVVLLYMLASALPAWSAMMVMYDKNWQTEYYIRDGQVFDLNWNRTHYLKDDRVYDLNWQLQYYLKDDRVYDLNWQLQYYLRERNTAEPQKKSGQ